MTVWFVCALFHVIPCFALAWETCGWLARSTNARRVRRGMLYDHPTLDLRHPVFPPLDVFFVAFALQHEMFPKIRT